MTVAISAEPETGRTVHVRPGFVDEHLHIEAWLRAQLSVRVAEGRVSRSALVAALRDRSRQSEWLVLFGLDHGQRTEDCLGFLPMPSATSQRE